MAPIDPGLLNEIAGRAMVFGAGLLWRSTVLLCLLLAVDRGWRRGPATARHLLWTLSLAAFFVLPVLGTALPAWEVDALPAWNSAVLESPPAPEPDHHGPDVRVTSRSVSAHHPSLVESIRAELAQLRPPVAVLLLWETGTLLALLWFLLGLYQLRRLVAESRPLDDPAWTGLAQEVATEMGLRSPPRLRRTEHARSPMVWGWRRPSLTLPRRADRWPIEQRRNALRHEMAHLARHDLHTQFLAQFLCALFWFCPLAWVAAGRMRVERERACDDRVLIAGSRASTYAEHLLEMARSLHATSPLAAATLAMARRSQLAARVDALLQPRPRRVGPFGRAAVAIPLALLLLPLAAIRPAPAQSRVGEPPSRNFAFVVADRSPSPAPPTRARFLLEARKIEAHRLTRIFVHLDTLEGDFAHARALTVLRVARLR